MKKGLNPYNLSLFFIYTINVTAYKLMASIELTIQPIVLYRLYFLGNIL